jgi:hypothetical protein
VERYSANPPSIGRAGFITALHRQTSPLGITRINELTGAILDRPS